MVIEHLQIERTVKVHVTVTGDGITKIRTVVEIRTTHPGIMPRIRQIPIHPIQDRQFIQRELIAHLYLLLIVERLAPVQDTLLH